MFLTERLMFAARRLLRRIARRRTAPCDPALALVPLFVGTRLMGSLHIEGRAKTARCALEIHIDNFFLCLFFRVGAEQHLHTGDYTILVFPYFRVSCIKSK
jgi:hypothetical protein